MQNQVHVKKFYGKKEGQKGERDDGREEGKKGIERISLPINDTGASG